SPAISSHPGKRSVVGQRIHGVDQCSQSQTVVSRTLPATFAGRSRLLRSSFAGRPRGASEPRARIWDLRLLLFPLLVSRPPIIGTAGERDSGLRPTGFSILSLLGERELDTALGW